MNKRASPVVGFALFVITSLLAIVRVTGAITLVFERSVVCADERLPTIILTLVLARDYVAANRAGNQS